MLPPFIIEQIRKREEEERKRYEQHARNQHDVTQDVGAAAVLDHPYCTLRSR